MKVTHEYDVETQKLIDKLQEYIISIRTQYEFKLNPKTAIECSRVSRPGYKETIIKEYGEAIKPFQKRLEQIYLTSVPKIIITGINADNTTL